MSKVTMITKDNCPQCNKLKMFLQFALNNKYKDDIHVVNKETNVDEYERLTSEHSILTVPVLIADGEVLSKTEPTPVVDFLERYIGKK